MFQDLMKQDAAEVFSNPDEFGEFVIYTPKGGSPVSIAAVLERNAPQKTGATPRQLSTKTTAHVSKSLISSRPTVDSDTITITGVAQPQKIVALEREDDPAMWHMVLN